MTKTLTKLTKQTTVPIGLEIVPTRIVWTATKKGTLNFDFGLKKKGLKNGCSNVVKIYALILNKVTNFDESLYCLGLNVCPRLQTVCKSHMITTMYSISQWLIICVSLGVKKLTKVTQTLLWFGKLTILRDKQIFQIRTAQLRKTWPLILNYQISFRDEWKPISAQW